MFGLFVRFNFCISLFLAGWAQAQTIAATAKQIYRGQVITQDALVYKSADFDSPVLIQLSKGQVYQISKKIYGAFHQIKVGKILGYISDVDVSPVNFRREGAEKPESKKEKPKDQPEDTRKKAEIKKRRSMELTRYLGVSFASLNYKEDTMGGTRSEALTFFGIKLAGPNVLIEGPFPTELNVRYSSGAPSYYEKRTGQSAGGFLFTLDMQYMSVGSLSKDWIRYFGFGPFFRYSKFDLSLRDSTTNKVTSYNADDMALGMIFTLGTGYRLGSFALRPEFNYVWEKQMYYGFSLAAQFEF